MLMFLYHKGKNRNEVFADFYLDLDLSVEWAVEAEHERWLWQCRVVILLFLVHTRLPVLQINTVFPDSLDSCFLSWLSFTKIRLCTSVWALLPLLHSLGKRQIIKALCSCSLFHQLDHFQSSSVGVSLWLQGCWCCLSALYNYLSRCLSDLYLLNVDMLNVYSKNNPKAKQNKTCSWSCMRSQLCNRHVLPWMPSMFFYLTSFLFPSCFIEPLNEEDKAKMIKSKKKMRQKVQRGESQTAVQGQVRRGNSG